MKKRMFAAMFIALCALGLAACAQDDTTQEPDSKRVSEFRLGEASMEEAKGTVTFPMDGVIGVPAGDKAPVVFILHGAHGPEDVTESRFYKGFSYLVEKLAEEGYLAISINLNRAYVFEPFEGDEQARAEEIYNQYYSLLERANKGEKVFDVDITGKADLNRLNFIGHSRGGDNSLKIAKSLMDKDNNAVKSVLVVASPLNADEEDIYLDLPIGVILPQYDGDVADLASSKLFNYAYFEDDDREEPLCMAFLYGGNHAMFNTAIPQEDTMAPPKDVTYISGEQQRNFLTLYATDFLNAFNLEKQNVIKLLGNEAATRYGIDFASSIILPNREDILFDENTKIEAKGTKLSEVTFSTIPEKNTIAPFNPPGPLKEDIEMYKFSWSKAEESLTVSFPEENWSGNSSLSLLIANDPTNPINTAKDKLLMEIELTDRSGAKATVEIGSEEYSLRYHEATVSNIFEGMEGLPEYFQAEKFTPLAIEIIFLSDFQGINLSQIVSIDLRGVSDTGACILGGITIN